MSRWQLSSIRLLVHLICWSWRVWIRGWWLLFRNTWILVLWRNNSFHLVNRIWSTLLVWPRLGSPWCKTMLLSICCSVDYIFIWRIISWMPWDQRACWVMIRSCIICNSQYKVDRQTQSSYASRTSAVWRTMNWNKW